MVRSFGFMQRTLAGTDLHASAVHALIDIGRAGALQANALARALRLDKSTVSRLIRSLTKQSLICAERDDQDARRQVLRLTPRGAAVLTTIDRHADAQIAAALARLDAADREAVIPGVTRFAEALSEAGPMATAEPTLHSGPLPGLAGRIVDLHATYYNREADLGAAFEAVVAKGLADFLPRACGERNGIWHAQLEGRFAGSIAIDGEDLGGNVAHLRWFIVADDARGRGLGGALLDRALAFVDARAFDAARLWTFEGLDAARRLYEARGFVLEEAYPGEQWGQPLTEQRFVRSRPVTAG